MCSEIAAVAVPIHTASDSTNCKLFNGRGGGIRTHNPRFWRPVLCQLSYTPVEQGASERGAWSQNSILARSSLLAPRFYSLIFVTTPEPTVLPPSRIANRTPSSMAIGFDSSTAIRALSPGMHISAPPSKLAEPVTSVVRK